MRQAEVLPNPIAQPEGRWRTREVRWDLTHLIT